ncbi:hypothetical protein F5Y16DRAFT_399767 [Xylariaceae sp. FL0255]|nr:hypothetical protein F5Y16DRAFT_399767 [Xylariaceae sp. FL0255]
MNYARTYYHDFQPSFESHVDLNHVSFEALKRFKQSNGWDPSNYTTDSSETPPMFSTIPPAAHPVPGDQQAFRVSSLGADVAPVDSRFFNERNWGGLQGTFDSATALKQYGHYYDATNSRVTPIHLCSSWWDPSMPAASQVSNPTSMVMTCSDDPNDGKRHYLCSECERFFSAPKDLRRHYIQKHPTGLEPLYQCRCEKFDPRKDNHKRHISTCRGEQCIPFYICACTSCIEDKHQHLAHLDKCKFGHGRPGRPSAS